MTLPPVVAEAGGRAAKLTLEFFAARVPNPNTRRAYGKAVQRFCAWCSAHGVGLLALEPTTIAAYLEELKGSVSVASVKLQASGLRHWLDYLTERGVLSHNPALSVRTPRLVVDEGKTPVLERAEARALFASLEEFTDIVSLRDRALFAVMLFGFVRVGAVVNMTVRDFADEGENAWLVLHAKGGKERRIPCHHRTREYVRAYIAAAGLEPGSRTPLFQSAPRRSGALSGKAMSTGAVLDAVKRHCRAAGLPSSISNHSFRATGLTIHHENGGSLEDAQALAGHADARTTRLYIRKNGKVSRAEVERVQIGAWPPQPSWRAATAHGRAPPSRHSSCSSPRRSHRSSHCSCQSGGRPGRDAAAVADEIGVSSNADLTSCAV
jgi:site-specific recombinase XerD